MSIRGSSLSFLPHPSTSLEGYDFMLGVPIQSSESLPNTSYIFWQTVILLNIVQLCQGLPQKRLLGSTTQKEASLVAQMVKNLPAMRQTWVWSFGLGRSPGGGHSNPFQNSCLENSHGQRSLGGYSPWCRKESDTTERLSTALHIQKEMEILNLRIQIPKWIWGSPLQSSQFYSLNSLNKRVPSPINLQHDPIIYSWEVTERILWIGTKLPINEYNLHSVFLCEAPAPLRILRNLLCVLNLWFHQDQGGGKKDLT